MGYSHIHSGSNDIIVLHMMVNLVNGLFEARQARQQALEQVEFEHIGAIALGHRGILMGFKEQAVGSSGDSGTCHRLDEFGAASGMTILSL